MCMYSERNTRPLRKLNYFATSPPATGSRAQRCHGHEPFFSLSLCVCVCLLVVVDFFLLTPKRMRAKRRPFGKRGERNNETVCVCGSEREAKTRREKGKSRRGHCLIVEARTLGQHTHTDSYRLIHRVA